MSRIVLSEAARADAREITAYTADRFGIAQARRLRDRFRALLEQLVRSPHIGRTNEALDPPGRTFRYLVVMKSILVVYEFTDGGIRVARLIPGARNIAAELERDAGDERFS